ncbi:cytochrome P450 [Alloactinosynnema sp. L-07]|uniref:cytochrome P450 n=1 Tax=Alloactinosynnema sp. L-07 TaxID=1653480 RepID=UPI00065F01CF|nr:cytochrome P450 [Alloactinosynnema sp. L-07]CRK58263.1 cytochrome P450 [Alloactinosynnema sp. L-07]
MTVPVAPGRWPVLGHTPAILRHRLGFTSSLRQYGDVVRIDLGPMPAHVVTTPELAHRVLVTEGAAFEKGAMFDKFRAYVGNGLVLSSGAFHRRQRRLMQPSFHRDELARYPETMVRATTDLTDSWEPGAVREVDQDMQAVAVTIVGETLFSAGLGRAAIEEARRSIPLVIKYGMLRVLSPSLLERLPIPVNRRFDEATARMRAIVLDLIAQRRATGVDRGDLLSRLLLARDETGAGMDDEQVHDEVITLLSAGIETSALALAWIFHELGRDAEVRQRVHAEVDEVLSGRTITFDDVPKLEYTRRVVDETLRKYPLWILMRRATTEVDLGDVRLTAGDEVIVSPHALHHDPHSYANPMRFDPDRWTPERSAALPKGAYIPFGAGTRQCIGNSFALTEIIAVVATVAARWDLVPVPGKPVVVKVTSTAYPSRLPMTTMPR